MTIGVIDSGLGGLAIARAIWKRLPWQSTIYLADHAYFPYGDKTAREINSRLPRLISWLVERKVKMVVIACNTITATAIDGLRQRFDIPFVGTEPTVKQGGIVLVTPATAASERYRKLAHQYGVTTIACPGLAEAIERGLPIEPYLPPLLPHIRRLVLGCTHYLLVKEKIQKFYGRKITLIDPSEAIARQTATVLPKRQSGRRQFFTTGSSLKATRRASQIFKQRIIFKQCSL